MMKPFDPWGGRESLESLWRDLDRFVPSVFRGSPQMAPPVNVFTSADGASVMAEVPGLEASRIEVAVEGNRLKLRAAPSAEPAYENAVYLRRERVVRGFERDVELPFPIEPDGVEATLRDGILWIQLQRAGRGRARKIEVR
jgi:HSP20 family protein